MKVAALGVVMAVLALVGAVPKSEEDGSLLVSVKGPPLGQQPEKLLKQWKALPIEIRKRIDDVCVTTLGLSSTGSIQLIGIYIQQLPGEVKPQRLFHLQQTDLFGSRLVWSILVDPENEKYRILFDISQRGDDGPWLTLWDD